MAVNVTPANDGEEIAAPGAARSVVRTVPSANGCLIRKIFVAFTASVFGTSQLSCPTGPVPEFPALSRKEMPMLSSWASPGCVPTPSQAAGAVNAIRYVFGAPDETAAIAPTVKSWMAVSGATVACATGLELVNVSVAAPPGWTEVLSQLAASSVGAVVSAPFAQRAAATLQKYPVGHSAELLQVNAEGSGEPQPATSAVPTTAQRNATMDFIN